MRRIGMQLMLGIFDVNGLATLASVSDKETPAWAAFRALRKGSQTQMGKYQQRTHRDKRNIKRK